MAWTEFYVDVGAASASNLNAGTTTGSGGNGAPSVTSTNGDWDNASAGRFTAASGTPFSGVSVGEWASIYLDAATTAVFVSQITAVDAGGTYIEVSKTAHKVGTAPAAGANGRSCRVGGSWLNLGFSASIFASGQTPTADFAPRIQIKAGTYANTTTARAIYGSANTAYPLWIRGYNTTPGDLDGYSVLTKPSITFTTGAFTLATAYTWCTGLSVSASTALTTTLFLTGSAGPYFIKRCQIINAGTNANSRAFGSASSVAVVMNCCFLQASSSATGVISFTGSTLHLVGCTVTGGGYGIYNNAASTVVLDSCTIRDTGSHGLYFLTTTPGRAIITGCTFSNVPAACDAILFDLVPGYGLIVNCAFASIGGYGIKNNSGATTATLYRANNLYYSCTSGPEYGLGDSPGFGDVLAGSDPRTSSTDMTPTVAGGGRAVGSPGHFENESYTSYPDMGSVQHGDPVIVTPAAGKIYAGQQVTSDGTALVTGTLHASNMHSVGGIAGADLAAADLLNGQVVDDVTGTLVAAGGGAPVFGGHVVRRA